MNIRTSALSLLRPAVAFASVLSLPEAASAQAIGATGYARDMSVDVVFDGSAGADSFLETLNGRHLNAASGTTPPFSEAYGVGGTLMTADEVSVPLTAELAARVRLSRFWLGGNVVSTESDAGVFAGDAHTASRADLDGGTITVYLADTEVLLVGTQVTIGGPDALASVEWDDISLNPSASSDFIARNGPDSVHLSVVGEEVAVPALLAGQTVTVPVAVNTVDFSVTGSVQLTPDLVAETNNGVTATASATNLLAGFSLTVVHDDGVLAYTTRLEGQMTFGTAYASLTVVPEPAGATLALLGGMAAALRRRRRI